MTRETIITLTTRELVAIVRSTNPAGRHADAYWNAAEELARRAGTDKEDA